MIAKIPGFNIRGVAGYVPTHHGFFDEESQAFTQTSESNAKLKLVMGYDKHHYLRQEKSFTDFAKLALQDFFSREHVSADQVDAIIVVTQSPDNFLPNNSSKIHGMFSFRSDCYCVDLPDGCAGYIRGLFEAGMLFTVSDAKNILLISGDVLSTKVSRSDRNSFPLIGDAISISLLGRSSQSVSDFEFNFKGAEWDAITIPAGAGQIPSTEKTRQLNRDDEGNMRSSEQLVMKGREVFSFTQTTVVDFADYFMKKHFAEIQPRYVFSHQPNRFILDRIKKRLKLQDDQMITDVVSKYGNSSSATIPLAMIMQEKKVDQAFDCMLLGFGVGLTWAATKLTNVQLQFCFLEEIDI